MFGRGMRLHAERAQISPESFQRRRVRIIEAAERLIKGPPLGKGMAWRLQQRYQRLWSELFVFLSVKASSRPTMPQSVTSATA
ncbi:MAG: hypothetical protein U0821_20945 [Chloroflexota bacterium]